MASAYLSEQNKSLQQENSNLRAQLERKEKEITDLKQQLLTMDDVNKRQQQETYKLKQQSELREKETRHLRLRIQELEKQKKLLLVRIIELRKRQCDLDCVVCALTKICEKGYFEEGVKLCNLQLSKILTVYALQNGATIEKEDVECQKFLEILVKGGIVRIIAKYTQYPNDNNVQQRTVDEVWEKMTTSGYNAMILGMVVPLPAIGHAVLCYFNAQCPGTVTVYDPQESHSDNEGYFNQKAFRDFVAKYSGIIVYGVHLRELENIITQCKDVLHLQDERRQLYDNEQATNAMP